MLSKIPSFFGRKESERGRQISGSKLQKKGTTLPVVNEGDDSFNVSPTKFVDEIRAAANSEKKTAQERRKLLAGLVGELDGYGAKLTSAPSIQAFLTYRSALQKITVLATDEAYALRSKQFPQQGSTKEFSFVEVMSEEIDSLLSMVRHSSTTSMQLAKKVVEIKGLVVDYFG